MLYNRIIKWSTADWTICWRTNLRTSQLDNREFLKNYIQGNYLLQIFVQTIRDSWLFHVSSSLQDGQFATWLTTSWFVGNLSNYRMTDGR